MIYTALIAGVKGLLFYTFKDYVNNSTINLSQTAMWNESKNAALNIKTTLGQILLNGQLTKDVPTNSSQLKVSYWVYNGTTYLIAINSSQSAVNASISFDATGKIINPLFSNIPGTLVLNSSTKKLEANMASMEVQAIKIN